MNRIAQTWRDLGDRAWGRLTAAAAIVLTGVLLGQQYMNPNKRVIAVMVAVVLAGMAWRVDMLWGLGVLVLTVPYPRGTVFGNSNVALVLVLLVIWLLRITQRQAPPPRRTPLDVPIVGLFIAFIVSFYNIPGQPDLGYALENMQLLATGMLMFVLIVSNLRTEAQLKRFHVFQVSSLVTIMLLAIYELNHPGGEFIPGWITFHHTLGDEFNLKNVRVGGPFFDYEILAEFTAINLLLVAFMLARATSRTRQVILSGVFLLSTFILFATVTRGAFISLGAALFYLFWIVRRRIRFVPLVVGLATLVVLFLAMNAYVANFTRSGDLLARLIGTQFYGFVPDSRQTAWADGWERFLQHPIIGHGPHYSSQTGTRTWFWPHNGYLYIANLVGLVGLAFYLWLLARMILISRPTVDSLRHPSYAASFLIIGHIQLILFAIDQMKIDFLRNPIYTFEVWINFAGITSAYLIRRGEQARGREAAEAPERVAGAGR